MARRKDADTEVLENENTELETADTELEVPEDVEVPDSPEGIEDDSTDQPSEEEQEERDTSGDTVHTDGEVKPADSEKKEAEIDLTAFEAAAQGAVAQRDDDTGELPEGALEPVLTAYRELPSVKARNRAKDRLKDLMKSAMEGMNLSLARAFFSMNEAMTTATGKAADKKPADPTAAYKHSLAVALLAYGELASNPPEGVSVDEITTATQAPEMLEKVTAYRTWLDTEVAEGEEKPQAPETPSEIIAAFKLVRGGKVGGRASGGGSGRVSTPHDGPRRDLGKHITEAFAEVESGTFLSVADIRKFRSSEYEDEQPSAGAISARLFPNKGECTVEGIRPGTGGEKGTKGAYKE